MSRLALPAGIVLTLDCAMVYLSGLAAYVANHGLAVTVGNLSLVALVMLGCLLPIAGGFLVFGTFRGTLRRTSFNDLMRVGASLALGLAVVVIVKITWSDNRVINTLTMRDLMTLCCFSLIIMCGLRIAVKGAYDAYLRYTTSSGAYGYSSDRLINLEMADLLERHPIKVNMEHISKALSSRRIMVTGAAGSIGSELSKMLADISPAELLLVDQAESPLHALSLELERLYPNVKCRFIVADICNSMKMENLFRHFRPEILFHAAAYKHVPLMEDNPCESVINNIEGTRTIADLAVEYGTQKFILVSTDKAVNPTNVMGCSKRICEMYCQSLSKIQNRCRFITTRFGNVLGSNGSVIPIFREQIRRGGPVKVTHPDIIRYFMLIPEACSLVLEAAVLGTGGEIFAFDMGRPVRIVDLARRMIALSGRFDVRIEFSGLRPGEKLYEELLTDKERVIPSSHPKIKIAKVYAGDYAGINADIDRLVATARSFDKSATVRGMKEMVPEFISSNPLYSSPGQQTVQSPMASTGVRLPDPPPPGEFAANTIGGGGTPEVSTVYIRYSHNLKTS